MNQAICGAVILLSREPPEDFSALFDSIGMKSFNSDTWKKIFDYRHSVLNGEDTQAFVSVRRMSYTAFRIGEPSNQKNNVHAIVHRLLALNSEIEASERDLPYKELAYSRVFQRTPGRFMASVCNLSPKSKFLVMTRDIPVYFTVVCSDTTAILMWSNEQSLDQRLKDVFGTRLFYYRMPVLTDGLVLIPDLFLRSKMQKWTEKLGDRLKVMNALESYLMKKPANM